MRNPRTVSSGKRGEGSRPVLAFTLSLKMIYVVGLKQVHLHSPSFLDNLEIRMF